MHAVTSPVIETRDLSLHAAGRALVLNLNWRVLPGQRWCVIGRNAAGKSTLLRALAGLRVPHHLGELLWHGQAATRWSALDAAALRAFMPQTPSDHFAISVERLLALAVVRPTSAAPAQVMAALDVQHLAQRSLRELSGGERQRVALAQCAMQGAPLMLLDEPVSFQDPAHQQLVSRWLAQGRGGDESIDSGQGDAGAGVDARADAGAGVGTRAHAWVATAHDVNWVARTATHVLALLGDGAWQAGRCEDMLGAVLLEQVYGCPWQCQSGVWQAL